MNLGMSRMKWAARGHLCHVVGRSLRPPLCLWRRFHGLSLTRRKPSFAIPAALGFPRRLDDRGDPSLAFRGALRQIEEVGR